MRHRWIRRLKWFGISLLAILVIGIATLYVLSRDWAPGKPDSIARGDHTYTRELAEHRFEELLDRHDVPGGAAALIVDQEVVWQATAGFADIARSEAVTAKTVFKLWSLAKLVTALETMRLVEEGLLDLDAPVKAYVPDFRVQSRFGPGEQITVRHLLTHHSGLPRNACVDESNWHLGTDGVDRHAATLADCRLAYPTGSRYKYSNTAYDLLGYVIQAKRREIFQPYMRKHLLLPIGMTDSAYWSTDVPRERSIATGYAYFDGEHHARKQHDVAAVPSGNLYASLDDLTSLAKFIFREGEAGGRQLIQAKTLRAMTEDQRSGPEDPQPMGLGWRLSKAIPGEVMAWHDGGPSEGIGVQLVTLPERKLGAVFVGNCATFGSGFVMPVAVELLKVMLETEYGIESAARKPPEAYAVDATTLRAYTGAYVAFGRIMDVKLSGDDLEAVIDGTTLDLIPRSEHTFGVSHWVHRLGLSRIFNLPYDLDAFEMEFQSGADRVPDRLVIDLGRVAFEVCPRYGKLPGGVGAWKGLVGVYQRKSRLADGSISPEARGTATITLVDGRLIMSSAIGPIVPLDEETLVALGGPFAGETIVRDPQTGTLTHQGYVYFPDK